MPEYMEVHSRCMHRIDAKATFPPFLRASFTIPRTLNGICTKIICHRKFCNEFSRSFRPAYAFQIIILNIHISWWMLIRTRTSTLSLSLSLLSRFPSSYLLVESAYDDRRSVRLCHLIMHGFAIFKRYKLFICTVFGTNARHICKIHGPDVSKPMPHSSVVQRQQRRLLQRHTHSKNREWVEAHNARKLQHMMRLCLQHRNQVCWTACAAHDRANAIKKSFNCLTTSTEGFPRLPSVSVLHNSFKCGCFRKSEHRCTMQHLTNAMEKPRKFEMFILVRLLLYHFGMSKLSASEYNNMQNACIY